MLNTMLEKQKELQLRLGTNFDELSPEDRAAFMRNHFVYLDQELQEALYEVPYFKLWKDYSKMTDEEYEAAWAKVKMELVDAFHFFMNLLLCAGIDAGELFSMYMAKNSENHRRQDAGYTHDVSYKEQAVEDVMQPTVTTQPELINCILSMPGKIDSSNDFIAILHKKNGDASICFNTDVCSIGMAIKTLAKAYVEEASKCTPEERKALDEVLGDAMTFSVGGSDNG